MDDYLREILARQEAGQEEMPEPEEVLLKISSGEMPIPASGEGNTAEITRETPEGETPGYETPETEQERDARLWETEAALGRQSPGQRFMPEFRENRESGTASGSGWPEALSPERETAARERGMNPEELSMYFQRDARRYS